MIKNFKRLKVKILAIIALLPLCACKVNPDYGQATVDLPENYKEAEKAWKVAKPQDEMERGPWWTIFKSSKLNALEEKLNNKNFSIAIAQAQYEQAQALVKEAQASYFPTLAGDFSKTRQKSSQLSNQSSAANRPFTNYTLSTTASWELDLWDVIRDSVDASRAGAAASAAQLASVRLSMQASLAQYYFQLCILDMDQKILDNKVAAYKKTLQITKNQYAVGVASSLNVATAEGQLQSMQTQAIDNTINRTLYEHAIAILIGEAPANFSLPSQAITLTPPSIPVDLPSALLERRPDIAAAERTMAQANAQVGVASKAYFPILTLSGTGGFQSNRLRYWFSQPDKFWSLGPQLAATLLDGGLREAELEAVKANYEASIASYRQTVLTAFQEVEDNLATLRILRSEALLQNKIVENAELALKIVNNQYHVGAASALDVLNAQITLYEAKESVIDLAGRRMVATVNLIKALGGGWRTDL